MRYLTLRKVGLLMLAALLCGCIAAGQSKDDKRRHVENMRKEVLTELYKINSGAAKEIERAPGYAVFSNWNAYLIFASVGQGYGVVVDNVSGAHTYMQMGSIGGGLGAGVKDYRGVYIFAASRRVRKIGAVPVLGLTAEKSVAARRRVFSGTSSSSTECK